VWPPLAVHNECKHDGVNWNRRESVATLAVHNECKHDGVN
jgi:hypothetical protein